VRTKNVFSSWCPKAASVAFWQQQPIRETAGCGEQTLLRNSEPDKTRYYIFATLHAARDIGTTLILPRSIGFVVINMLQ